MFLSDETEGSELCSFRKLLFSFDKSDLNQLTSDDNRHLSKYNTQHSNWKMLIRKCSLKNQYY